MTAVPSRVLQWLYSSLKPQYQHVDRTYSDVAQTLQNYISISPQTDVHTFDDGSSALLLLLKGTLPVQFRGAEYKFPVAIWVPHAYPREAPIIFVTPTPDMVVRPGQHISGEGRIYHPYLANWSNHWDKSNVNDFLHILADIFSKEPPVMSRLQQTQYQARGPVMVQPRADSLQQPAPPRPPPPKPPEAGGFPVALPVRNQSLSARQTYSVSPRPPALPPKPGQVDVRSDYDKYSVPPPVPQYDSALRNDMIQLPSPHLPLATSGRPQSVYQPPPLRDPTPHHNNRNSLHVFSHPGQGNQAPMQQQQQPRLRPQPAPHFYYPQQSQPIQRQAAVPPSQQPQARPKPPVQDLMSGPLDVTLPIQSSEPLIAPPIPPNPEKDALLHAISTALVGQASQIISQNNAALPSLQAQSTAMQQAYQNMSSELSQLQALDAMLNSNERILQEAMLDANRMMEGVKSKKLPNVDDVLVAPTVVGEQLYGLVSEVLAIEDAMFALTRALDRGRVPADVYIKQTRSLAREQFLKKALIKKIGKGMSLSEYGT